MHTTVVIWILHMAVVRLHTALTRKSALVQSIVCNSEVQDVVIVIFTSRGQ